MFQSILVTFLLLFEVLAVWGWGTKFFFFQLFSCILPILGVSLLPPCSPALSKLSFFNKVIFIFLFYMLTWIQECWSATCYHYNDAISNYQAVTIVALSLCYVKLPGGSYQRGSHIVDKFLLAGQHWSLMVVALNPLV